MPQASLILTNFNGGEWSDDLEGRIDNDYYGSAGILCENFLSKVQGPLGKRPGTRFVRRTKFQDRRAIMVRFQFSLTQMYMLEVGHQYIRFYRNNAPITLSPVTISGITKANPAVVTTSASHGYTTGDEVFIASVGGMSEVNNKWYKITVLSSTTFSLQTLDSVNVNSTAYTTYTSGGTSAKMYEISTPWDEADLPNLRWTQSADVMFFACAGKAPRTLTRSGHTSWTLALYDFEDGPYLTTNTTATTIAPSATSGTVTLTASAALFTASDVGRWVRIRHASTWGCAKITVFTSATVVTATTLSGYSFGATTASAVWRQGFWFGTNWPTCVEFFQNRLWWFTNSQVDGSYSGDFYQFSPTEPDGTVTDSNGIQRQLGARDVNDVVWAVDNEKALIIGTRDGEWVLRANSLGEAVSPTNVNATRSTDFGSKNVMATRVQGNALFAQKTGRMLCQMGYDLNVDGFNTVDLNLFNTRINQAGIRQFAHMGHPDNHTFCVMENGEMSVLTYNPSQAIRGWSRFTSPNAWFESVATGAAPSGDRDEAWMIVRRRVGNTFYRYVEYLTDMFRHDDLQEDAILVDSSLTYDGRRYPSATITLTGTGPYTFTASSGVFVAGDVGKTIKSAEGAAVITGFTSSTVITVASYVKTFTKAFYDPNSWWIEEVTSSVSGMEHLEGQTVTVVGDGAVLVPAVVTNGAVALSEPSCVVHVGIGYSSRWISNRPNGGAADGTAQGKTKRVDKIVMRVWRSLGGRYGQQGSQFMDDITFRSPDEPMDLQMPLYSGDTPRLELPGDYDQEGRIVIEHDEPIPFTLVALIMMLVTQDGR